MAGLGARAQIPEIAGGLLLGFGLTEELGNDLVPSDVRLDQLPDFFRRHRRVVGFAFPTHQLVILARQRILGSTFIFPDDDIGPQVTQTVATSPVDFATGRKTCPRQRVLGCRENGIRSASTAVWALADGEAVLLHSRRVRGFSRRRNSGYLRNFITGTPCPVESTAREEWASWP
jgi:hypothetical protein